MIARAAARGLAASGLGGRDFLVATDARRKEVYWARYTAAGQRVRGPEVAAPGELDARCPVAGEGAAALPRGTGPADRAALPIGRLAGRADRRAPGAGRACARGRAAVPAPARRADPRPAQAGDAMTGQRLRPMTPADLTAVLGLERELFGEEAWSRAMLRGELAQQPRSRYYLVAEDNEVIAGYAGLLAAGSQGEVLTLAVAAADGARAPDRRCWRRCWPKRRDAAAPRSSWRYAPITSGPSSSTAGTASCRSGSAAATTSRPARMPW